jgi:excisionase family DNA binding protein
MSRSSSTKVAEELLPVAELAKRWHCSANLIYRLIASGELGSTQIGQGRAKTRVPASAAAEFIDRRSSRTGR